MPRQWHLHTRQVGSRAELARRYGISQPQLMDILRLPQPVLGLLLEPCRGDGSHYADRQLGPILRLPESVQIAALLELQERNSDG